MGTPHNRRGIRLRCAIVLGVALALTSACGGSSPARSATAPTNQSASSGLTSDAAAKAHRDTVTSEVVIHHPLHGTGGAELNDDNPGNADGRHAPAADQSNPCTLVSGAEARAILGKPIAPPQEAPLGPTCIYQPVGTRSFVTVAVEGSTLAQIFPHIHNRKRLEIRGHTAYCGDYGRQMTLVALSGSRVLNITAPCAVGRLFALKALSHG
jgi:hypothetical protein